MSLATEYLEALNDVKARPAGVDAYSFSLRQNVRAFWAGRRDFDQFLETLNDTIQFHLELAWRAGAAECGVRPDERTPEETARLREYILNQMSYTFGLAEFVEENTKANGGLLRTSLNRLPPWVNRYNEVKAIATQMACGDLKQMWVLGVAEHCKTCLKLAGRVMRGSQWAKLDVHPQDTRPGKLACRGFNCKCRFVETTKRATPGRLPRLP
ncbi:MAG: hypothetical protein GY743_23635 [Planctomycetaceae bacterium]|nr:hypothetical protein [Planctomycetaceae bacterium]